MVLFSLSPWVAGLQDLIASYLRLHPLRALVERALVERALVATGSEGSFSLAVVQALEGSS